MILHAYPPEEDDLLDPEFLDVHRDTTDLYGLIHARYILSPRGLAQMREKLQRAVFGKCPRVLCDNQCLLPVGVSETLRMNRVRLYCPRCQEVYEPPPLVSSSQNDIDGAYFGPSFPHVLLQTYPGFVPLEIPRPYEPRIFGFRIHHRKSKVRRKLDTGEFGFEFVDSKIVEEFGSADGGVTNFDLIPRLPTAAASQGEEADPC
eukprot:Polyplicarium_translucidae@DN2143_c0_g1_i3.p1